MLSEIVIVVISAMVLSLILKTFLLQAFSIPSESMEDTLLIGDRVLVSKLTPGPFQLHRGDIVVFKDPGGWLDTNGITAMQNGPLRRALTFVGLLPEDYGEHLIKRVIGLPGDTVTCCNTQGQLTVNDVAIVEPYVRAGDAPSELRFSTTVKPGHLWVMGDNRSASADSRSHQHIDDGQVPINDVVGKAFLLAWPLTRLGTVNEPPNVFAQVPPRTAGTG
jgi:signal peptidase I